MSDENYIQEISYKTGDEISEAIGNIHLYRYSRPVSPTDILFDIADVVSHIDSNVCVRDVIQSFMTEYIVESREKYYRTEAEIATALGNVTLFDHLNAVNPEDLLDDVRTIVSHIDSNVPLNDIKEAFKIYGRLS